jgi:cobalt/nickel transport system permease protein
VSRLAAALHDLRALDTLAARDTPLARRDPRAKLGVTLLFIVTLVSFDRYRLGAMLPLALYPAVLAAEGQVPARTLWRTLWLAAPFALLVGLANPYFDRAPMLALGGLEIAAGWVSFGSILLRVALSVSAGVVLVGGTGMHALCAALASLGAPRVFTAQLLLMHRYLFVLTDEAVRLQRAYTLRAAAGRRLPLTLYASLLGQLLLRAFDRAQRVHAAMLARGFDGQLRLAESCRWQRRDTAFVVLWGAYFALVRQVDLPRAIGTLITGALG